MYCVNSLKKYPIANSAMALKNCTFPVYVINLKKRVDRLESVKETFRGRKEFDLNVVQAFEEFNGAEGLWKTIRTIFHNLLKHSSGNILQDDDFIIICEDDHQFTDFYSAEFLRDCIRDSSQRGADILLGGVSWFNEAAQIHRNIFSVQTFSATQFVVVFRRFFNTIVEADFGPNDSADYKMASMSTKKFVIHPFISVQKEFGYSDATSKNNELGRVTAIFNSSIQRLVTLNKVWSYYRQINQREIQQSCEFLNKGIPTYLINFGSNIQEVEDAISEFNDKTEFDTTLVDVDDSEVSLFAKGSAVQQLVEIAINKDHQLIVLCGVSHRFTAHYSKDYFFESVTAAIKNDVKILSGGTSQFGSVVPITEHLYWVDKFTHSQFLVLFRSGFDEILNISSKSNIPLSMFWSISSSNKGMMHPCISYEKEFSVSSSLAVENSASQDNETVESLARLQFVREEYLKYAPFEVSVD